MCVAWQRLFQWVSNIRGVCVILSAFASRNVYSFDMSWLLTFSATGSSESLSCAYDVRLRWKTFSQQEISWSKKRIGLRNKAPKHLWKEWLSSTPSTSWIVGVAALWSLIWNIAVTVCDRFCDEEEHDSMINSSTINLLVGTAGMQEPTLLLPWHDWSIVSTMNLWMNMGESMQVGMQAAYNFSLLRLRDLRRHTLEFRSPEENFDLLGALQGMPAR